MVSQVEGDLQRAEERAEAGENKIVELEEELRVVGENLKALEVAEEKAQQREEEYKKQIKNLTDRSINMSLIVNTALKNCRILSVFEEVAAAEVAPVELLFLPELISPHLTFFSISPSPSLFHSTHRSNHSSNFDLSHTDFTHKKILCFQTQVCRVPRRVRREDGAEAEPPHRQHHERPRPGEDEDAERQRRARPDVRPLHQPIMISRKLGEAKTLSMA